MVGRSILAAAVFATSPMPAVAQTVASAPTPAPATAEEPKICKRETVTGSKARKRKICMTKAEWNNQWSRTREANEEMGSRYGRGLCLNSAGTGSC